MVAKVASMVAIVVSMVATVASMVARVANMVVAQVTKYSQIALHSEHQMAA